MSDAAANPPAERREQIAGELAEWMHAAAREAQRRLLDAESTEDFATLTGALTKLGRSVRQSLALQAKFEKERLHGEFVPPAAPAAKPVAAPSSPHEAALAKKRGWVRRGVERCLWDEYDPSDDDESETGLSLLYDLAA